MLVKRDILLFRICCISHTYTQTHRIAVACAFELEDKKKTGKKIHWNKVIIVVLWLFNYLCLDRTRFGVFSKLSYSPLPKILVDTVYLDTTEEELEQETL